MVSSDELQVVLDTCREYAGEDAPLYTCEHCNVRLSECSVACGPYVIYSLGQIGPEELLDTHLFSLERMLKKDEGFLKARPYRQHDTTIMPLKLETNDVIVVVVLLQRKG